MSVVIPVHDGEAHLAEAIESVLRQTMDDLELVVVDDGSTDGSAAIADELGTHDRRVSTHHQAHLGVSAALNRGGELARAPLIAWLGADDVALPDRLASQTEYLDAHPDVTAVGGGVTYITSGGRTFSSVRYPTHPEDVRARMDEWCAVHASAATIRKQRFQEIGGYRTAFRTAEDYDLWLRLCERGALANLPEPVIRCRVHGEQTTVRGIDDMAVSTVVARASARWRRERGTDPVEGSESLAGDLLAQLEIGPAELLAEHVGLRIWLAQLLERAGYESLARTTWQEALERASEGASTQLIAEVQGARARIRLEQGRPVEGGRLAAKRAWRRLRRHA